jgi:hypothetical protein
MYTPTYPPGRTHVALASALLLSALAFGCGPGGSTESQAQSTARPAEIAAAESQPGESASQEESIGFIVRFKPEHALGRAQGLEAAGRCEEAERLARQTLATSTELRGLCFERFTLGGVETVLISCAPVPSAQSAAYQRDWLARLRGMRTVEYADANVTVQIAECDEASPR